MPTEGNKRIIGDVVTSFNRDEKEEEVRQKAETIGLPYFDIRGMELAPDILSLISKEEAQMGIIPLLKKGDELTLGLSDPENKKTQETEKYLSGFFKITKALISWEAVKDALLMYEGLHKQKLEKELDYEIEVSEAALTFKELEAQLNAAPLKDILKFVLSAAIHAKSSDIHIEPQKEGARIRFRIDGVLHIIGVLKQDRFDYILSQIELSSGMKLNVDEAQEGRFEVRIKDSNISVRVETMPTLYGDDISLRLFNTQAAMLSLDDLGLYPYSKELLSNMLARPQGMVLVVGPTGSGKTTTIYAILNKLNKTSIKIVTLEDPIEYALPGITQSQIEEGSDFLTRLKAVLREDPDIIMVGEIRDTETAEVAFHASLTGHVIISTFHANNAAAAIGMLKEMSEQGTLLSAGLNMIIGQRLVRQLCEKCRKPRELSPEEYQFAQRVFNEIEPEIKEGKNLEFFESTGCEACNNLGFSGRLGIFEMLPVSVEIQKLISREEITISELQEAAKKSGMVTMEQDGLLKAIDGKTALSEVMQAVKE